MLILTTPSYLLYIGHVASSLVIGIVGMWLIASYCPDTFLSIQRGAEAVKVWVFNWPIWSVRAESALRLFLHETSIILMGLTLASRVLVGAIIAIVTKVMTGRAEHTI